MPALRSFGAYSNSRLARAFLAASILLAALMAMANSGGENRIFTATCVGVTDGDTIRVLGGDGETIVRLEGIDAPEKGDDYSGKAKKFLSAMVYGKTVAVHASGKDRYGRTLARVLIDGTDTSVELLRAGLAWHHTKYSDDLELAKAEALAKAAEINLWSLPNPLPPWEQRELRRKAETQPAPASNSEIVYHGNRRSHVFHAPWCRYYHCKNCTAVFHSREKAIAAGYRPGGHCRP